MPTDSRLSVDDFKKSNLKELYNKIICLTDFYPHAFMEDEKDNKILFQSVQYIPKKIIN